ncbi:hypothetical protein P3T76_015502 [Phytophthora citrophthora]|uniref:Retrotransposon gag domain-containing protein n=1 Tax=Phytophthora citrophthora TaxID=4793 RepID=A0AAD9LB32_9STRA|nr:hypothetical protein P3T76_015502 [Phytophthora citrophthora]
MSAISELTEFSGRDTDEDCARSWPGKVKSAFIRDQAPGSEKCIVFGNFLTGPARNWYQQLGRTTRGSSKDLLDGFRVEYSGLGVSLAMQYYHARKRSDESPLEYLHRLTVLGLRTKLVIKTGTPAVLREHVEHFSGTLDDRDLADQLTLLRLAAAGSTKYRQKLHHHLRKRHRSLLEQCAPSAWRSTATVWGQNRTQEDRTWIKIDPKSTLLLS